MMVRKYGRRGRGLVGSYPGTDSFSDVVSDSPSQEGPEDVFNFTFSSQESARVHWSDPYNFNSSQESMQLKILPPRKVRDYEDFDGSFRNPKKFKVVDFDSEPCHCSSSQDLKELGSLSISGGVLEKPNCVKKVDSDPFEYHSSEDLEELRSLPPRISKESSNVFDFSEDGDVWKPSKFKNTDSNSCGFNSSQELSDLGVSQPKKLNRLNLDGISRKSKKKVRKESDLLQKRNKRRNKDKMKLGEPEPSNPATTTTLMETQEFGEMMKHVDEVNFALDGLKKGQQVSIRRGSLLSLLSICKTMEQRRLLRVQGMAKTIIDAVFGLSLEDKTSNLAAAALLYIMTSDGQDDRLLDSPNCIRFLIKLLKPLPSSGGNEKAPTIGSKLLGMCKNTGLSQDSAKGLDSSSSAIALKVQEILVSCKEMKARDDSGGNHGMEDPEMNPKWISLLTMEKACLSTISIEDISGAVRRSGGKFKEKMRELGGLDAVFDVARKCHSTMEEWLQKSPTFALDLKDSLGLESLVMVLKCLKIMENATFLSHDNQCHLLGMKGSFDGERTPRSFTKLILCIIEILSGVSLQKNSQNENMDGASDGCCSKCASQKSSDGSLRNFSQAITESSTSGSCRSDGVILISSSSEFGGKKQPSSTSAGAMEDSQDPFAFDEDDGEPSKWDVLSGRGKNSLSTDHRVAVENRDYQSLLLTSQQESSYVGSQHSQEASCSCSSNVDAEKSNLLSDCLLTAVKVLMNLANDNPEGCRQIAACGGLEILSSLIAGHFPCFSSSNLLSKSSQKQSNTRLTDSQMDFLVAILGLLVNLVEKDGPNRSRLAACSVSVQIMEGLGVKDERGVIPLLCSIFLANHGAGEAAADGKEFSLEDEDSLLQGEKEAEKMIIEAYAALLLAFLSTQSKSIREAIIDCLPEQQNLTILVPVIERFVEFHMTLNMISADTHKTVLKVVESCRIP